MKKTQKLLIKIAEEAAEVAQAAAKMATKGKRGRKALVALLSSEAGDLSTLLEKAVAARLVSRRVINARKKLNIKRWRHR